MHGLLLIYRNILQGLGYGWTALVGGVMELLARIVFCVIASQVQSYFLICFAHVVAILAALAFFVITYYVTKKKWDTVSRQPAPIGD